MPPDGLDQLKKHDAIYFGAVGWPDVPDHISLWGLILPIRKALNQVRNPYFSYLVLLFSRIVPVVEPMSFSRFGGEVR